MVGMEGGSLEVCHCHNITSFKPCYKGQCFELLDNQHFSGTHLCAFTETPHLSFLDCPGITSDGLQYLTRTKELYLFQCPGITDVSMLGTVEGGTLEIYYCRNNINFMPLYKGKSFELSHNQHFSSAHLRAFTGTPYLDFCGCPGITNDGLYHLAQTKDLHLSECLGITDVSMLGTVDGGSLALSDCRNVTAFMIGSKVGSLSVTAFRISATSTFRYSQW